MSLRYTQFLAITVTLPASATAYNLVALIQTALTARNAALDPRLAPTVCRNLNLSFAPDLNTNAASHVYVGDSQVSATQRYFSMVPQSADNRISMFPANVPLIEVFVSTDTAGAELDVGVWQ